MTALTDALLQACRDHADRPAVGHAGGRLLSYRQVGERITDIAEALQTRGFGPGRRMLFSIRPAPDSMLLLAGALAAGGSIVFADPGMSRRLFDARVRAAMPSHAAVESLVYAAGAAGPIGALARRAGLSLPRLAELPVVHIRSGPWLPGVPRGAVSVRRLHATPTPIAPPVEVVPDEALIVFTSGTTAEPRGVVHTHQSLLAGFRSGAAALTIGSDAVVLTDQAMIGLPTLLSGACWMLPRLGLSTHAGPSKLARILHRHSDITHTFVVPGELPELLQLTPARPQALRAVVAGGAPVTPGLATQVHAAWPGAQLYAIYGMTELVPIAVATGERKVSWTGPGDPLGRLVDGVQARLADDGELMVSGPAMCTGYLTPVDGTVTAVDEVATGDLAIRIGDELALTGRKKDMIVRGTVNIYPGLYEPAISTVPGVVECALVGVGGGDSGDLSAAGEPEVVLALVIGEHGDGATVVDSVRRQLDNLIDRSAQPDRIVVIDAIPRRGRTRKPDRQALAAQLAG